MRRGAELQVGVTTWRPKHGYTGSAETLRTWLIEAGVMEGQTNAGQAHPQPACAAQLGRRLQRFKHMLIKSGKDIPIADSKTKFLDMCRHGDQLKPSLALTRIGNTGIGMQYEIHGVAGGNMTSQTIKPRAHGVVVYSEHLNGKAFTILDDLRSALLPFLKTATPPDGKNLPPDWAMSKGYANGILARGRLLFVGGQFGWNENQKLESDDFVRQTCQALLNMAAALKASGA